MSHWNVGDDDRCDCLTRDDHDLPHASRCEVARGTLVPEQFDHSDIRELAEIAANSDIDTALVILRRYRHQNGAA